MEMVNNDKKSKKIKKKVDTLVKRLVKDVKDIIKKPLLDNGIIYSHSEENLLKGYAIIFGPKDTIYENGVYFFEFDFPKAYPYAPPRLTYLTNNGKTRFNPNLYRNGKVCISILNTWRGPGWTSCMTIRTVLITLVSLFHNKPLLNEPGITEKHHAFESYNKIIQYRNFDTAIKNVMTKKLLPNDFKPLWPLIKRHFEKNKDEIIKKINSLREKEPKTSTYKAGIYAMTCTIDYGWIKEQINKAYKELI
jgi:ubiquitin-conjugating enzyme E2 Z